MLIFLSDITEIYIYPEQNNIFFLFDFPSNKYDNYVSQGSINQLNKNPTKYK